MSATATLTKTDAEKTVADLIGEFNRIQRAVEEGEARTAQLKAEIEQVERERHFEAQQFWKEEPTKELDKRLEELKAEVADLETEVAGLRREQEAAIAEARSYLPSLWKSWAALEMKRRAAIKQALEDLFGIIDGPVDAINAAQAAQDELEQLRGFLRACERRGFDAGVRAITYSRMKRDLSAEAGYEDSTELEEREIAGYFTLRRIIKDYENERIQSAV